MSEDAGCAEGFLRALFATVVKPISGLRLLISGLCALLLALSVPVEAQRPAKIHRVAVLSPGTQPRPVIEAFKQGLRDLGYMEGKNIVLEYRYADWKLERLPELAAELVRLKPDVIFLHSVSAAQAVKRTTTIIPVVVAAAGDLVQDGIVTNLARPGGNITGLTLLSPELDGKRLELLKETAQKVSRVAVLVYSGNLRGNVIPKTSRLPAGRSDCDFSAPR